VTLSGQKPVTKPATGSSNVTGQAMIPTTGTPGIAQAPVILWPDIKVKGVISQSDGSFLAIIEGVKNMVEAGQTIQIVRNGMVFRFKISEISKKGLVQQRLDYKPVKK
jgi:hypothetical protein